MAAPTTTGYAGDGGCTTIRRPAPAALAAIEDQLATRPELFARPYRATIEYLKPIVPGAQLSIHTRNEPDGFTVWFVVDAVTQAISRVTVRSQG